MYIIHKRRATTTGLWRKKTVKIESESIIITIMIITWSSYVIVGPARVIPARCRVDRFLRWRARAIPRVESARPPTSGCSTLTYLRDRITTVIVIFLSSCNGRSSRAPRAPARCATDRSSLRITAMTVAAVQQYNNNNNDSIYIYICVRTRTT